MATINLPHVEWRDGRPRFNPSKRLRALGFMRTNLESPAGAWMTLAETQAWIADLEREIGKRQAEPAPAAGPVVKLVFADRRQRRPDTPAAALTIEGVFNRLWREPQFQPEINGKPNPYALAPKTIKDYKGKASWLCRHHPNIWKSLALGVTRKTLRGLHKQIWLGSGLRMANAVLTVMGIAWKAVFDDEDDPQPFAALKLKSTDPRIRIGTPEEIAALLSAADRERDPGEGPLDPELGDAIVLALYTGQRQADVLELCEDERDAKGRLRFVQNKTGARVAMRPLPPLVARLADAKARKAAISERLNRPVPDNIVVTTWAGQAMKGMRCSQRFAEVRAEAARIVPSVATLWFMDLRDTAVTRLALAGCTIPEICSITGHELASATKVLKHYLELQTGHADAAMDKLEAWLEAEGATL